jgi:hypothetical protein
MIEDHTNYHRGSAINDVGKCASIRVIREPEMIEDHTNYHRGSAVNDVEKCVSIRVIGEPKMTEDRSSNVTRSENYHSLQHDGEILAAQPSDVCIGTSCLHAHAHVGDTISTEQNSSCDNYYCVYRAGNTSGLREEYENEHFQQKSSPELYRSKQSELPIKRKVISQCGSGVHVLSSGQYASVNVHTGSKLPDDGGGRGDDVMNVGGGYCFCTVSENSTATPVKKRRVDGGCKGHGLHDTQEKVIKENEYSKEPSDHPDYRGHPSEVQHENSENTCICSLNQSSKVSEVSHDSSDPNWTPPTCSQNSSSLTTDSSLDLHVYSTAVAISKDGELATRFSKKCTSSGASQDSQRNVIGNAVQERESESRNMQRIESRLYNAVAAGGGVCNVSKQLAEKCASSGAVSGKSGPGIAAQGREIESRKFTDMRAAPESSKKSNFLVQNPQQSKRNHTVVRPHAIYHLVAQPKKGKKPNSIASSTFGTLIDITNRGTGVEEGRKRRPSSSSTAAALDVFDYGHGTPAKPAGSKCRSNATGQLVCR